MKNVDDLLKIAEVEARIGHGYAAILVSVGEASSSQYKGRALFHLERAADLVEKAKKQLQG